MALLGEFNSNYNETKDYIGLYFRARRPILSVELNELQEIQRLRTDEVASAALVNGILSDSFELNIDDFSSFFRTSLWAVNKRRFAKIYFANKFSEFSNSL